GAAAGVAGCSQVTGNGDEEEYTDTTEEYPTTTETTTETDTETLTPTPVQSPSSEELVDTLHWGMAGVDPEEEFDFQVYREGQWEEDPYPKDEAMDVLPDYDPSMTVLREAGETGSEGTLTRVDEVTEDEMNQVKQALESNGFSNLHDDGTFTVWADLSERKAYMVGDNKIGIATPAEFGVAPSLNQQVDRLRNLAGGLRAEEYGVTDLMESTVQGLDLQDTLYITNSVGWDQGFISAVDNNLEPQIASSTGDVSSNDCQAAWGWDEPRLAEAAYSAMQNNGIEQDRANYSLLGNVEEINGDGVVTARGNGPPKNADEGQMKLWPPWI
ncbi:MAG: hypothetical protein ABEJ93_04645, partial [Candidatus Nanohalobium sp.]